MEGEGGCRLWNKIKTPIQYIGQTLLQLSSLYPLATSNKIMKGHWYQLCWGHFFSGKHNKFTALILHAGIWIHVSQLAKNDANQDLIVDIQPVLAIFSLILSQVMSVTILFWDMNRCSRVFRIRPSNEAWEFCVNSYKKRITVSVYKIHDHLMTSNMSISSLTSLLFGNSVSI